MRKVVSFSGGRTSAYLCKIMIETFGRENVDFIFMDTGAEHPKTYEFIKNVNDEFNLNLVCLRLKVNKELGKGNDYDIVDIKDICSDLKPFSNVLRKYGVPYISGMFCTDRLKLVPFKKYCTNMYGRNNYETWLGIRIDEPKRLSEKPYIKYMAEISEFEKQDVLDWWSKQDFDLDIDEWLGNCIFCPKKSNLKLAMAHREEEEQYKKWLSMIYSDSVRIDEKTGHYSKMYRGKQSLENIIKIFEDSTTKEIKQRIRGGKMLDTNSCSESCEVFDLS